MSDYVMLAVPILVGLAALLLLARGRRYAHGWTAAFIASSDFLGTPEWRRLRYDALRARRLSTWSTLRYSLGGSWCLFRPHSSQRPSPARSAS